MPITDLFPVSARASVRDHLEIAGCDLTELAFEFGTPLYAFDEATLRSQAENLVGAFSSRWPGTAVLYATKALFVPFLSRLLRDLGIGLDVTSEGELEVAKRTGFPPENIYLHGNCKTPAEIRAALAIGVDHLVVDRLDEIPLIASLAAERDCHPKLLIRLAPDVDPHTHRYLTTGVATSKFGLGIADGQALQAARDVLADGRLELVGLHVHLGSQIFDPDAYRHALEIILDVAAEWRTSFGWQLRELDLGGGWGVAYDEQQRSLAPNEIAELLCRTLEKGLNVRGLPRPRLLVEPGRALVARAGVAIYRVGGIKRVSDGTTYVMVDGGMGDNIRPSLYGAHYTARLANRFSETPSRAYAIAGRYCEQGDVLIDSVRLPEVRPDDLVVIPAAGAYQLPMASNYNLIPRPAVVLVSNGKARLVRRRETLADLLACDVDD